MAHPESSWIASYISYKFELLNHQKHEPRSWNWAPRLLATATKNVNLQTDDPPLKLTAKAPGKGDSELGNHHFFRGELLVVGSVVSVIHLLWCWGFDGMTRIRDLEIGFCSKTNWDGGITTTLQYYQQKEHLLTKSWYSRCFQKKMPTTPTLHGSF